MTFKEKYLMLKGEHKTDREIAFLFHMSLTALKKIKKLYDIPMIKRPRINNAGLTEEELQKGEKIGLKRKLMYKRVRSLGWSNEKAISEPKQCNKRTNGKIVLSSMYGKFGDKKEIEK